MTSQLTIIQILLACLFYMKAIERGASRTAATWAVCLITFVPLIVMNIDRWVGRTPGNTSASMLDHLTNVWIEDSTPLGLPNEKWAHDEVRKNMSKDVDAWRTVAANPLRAFVTKTDDKPQEVYVISLVGTDNKCVMLWVRTRDGSIRSITSAPEGCH